MSASRPAIARSASNRIIFPRQRRAGRGELRFSTASVLSDTSVGWGVKTRAADPETAVKSE